LTQLPSFGKRTLHAGEGYVGAPALRRLLTALGDLALVATPDATSDLTLDAPPIIVNIPQFSLFAFRTTEDRDFNVLQMPVIVGQTYSRTRTPVFVGDLQYVIFRPYWDVPRSIVVHEMLPRI